MHIKLHEIEFLSCNLESADEFEQAYQDLLNDREFWKDYKRGFQAREILRKHWTFMFSEGVKAFCEDIIEQRSRNACNS